MAATTYTLKVTGFCFAQARYLSDDEILRLAQQSEINFLSEMGSRIAIEGMDRPDCCDVYRNGTVAGPQPILDRLLGFYAIDVSLRYIGPGRLISTEISRASRESYVEMDECGKVFDNYSMAEPIR